MMENIEIFNNRVRLESKDLQLKLVKGEIDYDNEEIQFFIPCIVTAECLEWLNIIAENKLADEKSDLYYVKKFLQEVHDLREDNVSKLRETAVTKFRKIR